MAKIIIESNGDTTFRFKKYPDEEFQIKAKIFEIKKIENSSEVYTIKATQANTGELLFSEKISDITVDGAVYTNYEDLSEVLTPLLFKKGGGSGGGGTGGTVNVTSPITGDGDATPIGILPASSSNRGTISSLDFNKLAAFQAASNYALLTDITALDVSIKDWVEDKSYTTLSEVATSYYNKIEIDGKLSSTYKAKGNVANFAALPSSGNIYGDVYNLLDTGDNYVWIQNYNNTGSPGWDKLSGLVDLSNYYTKAETENAITIKGYATTSSVNSALSGKENTIADGTNAQYFRGDKTWQTLNKSAVGLPNVDNTSDVNKPISTAQQTALDNKLDKTVGTSQTVTSPVVFSSTISTTKVILQVQSSNTTIGAIWGDGNRTNYNGAGGTPKQHAYVTDLPTTFKFTPTGNFTTSQLKTAAENAGLIFNGLHFFINIGTNNFICTVDNGAAFPETIITIGKRGTTGSISFASLRTLNAGISNVTIVNGNENSMALLNFGTTQDLLTIINQ